MRLQWINVGPKCNDILIRKELSGDKRTQKEDSHVQTKEEHGLTQLQAKECQALLTTTKHYKQARKDSSLEPSAAAPPPTPIPPTL